MRFTRPSLLPSIIVALSLAILLLLGSWQWNKYGLRMSEKSACDNEMQNTESIIHGSNFDELHLAVADNCPSIFRGTLRPSPIITAHLRTHNGQKGFHLYGFLESTDGTLLLVNLGWSTSQEITVTPEALTLTGALIQPSGGNRFSPPNRPADNMWYLVDPLDVTNHYAIEQATSPRILYVQSGLEEAQESIRSLAPAPLKKTYLQPHTHLEYALFWFGMALTLLVIFILRFCRAK